MFLCELEKNEADTSIADMPEKVSELNTNTMSIMLRANSSESHVRMFMHA